MVDIDTHKAGVKPDQRTRKPLVRIILVNASNVPV